MNEARIRKQATILLNALANGTKVEGVPADADESIIYLAGYKAAISEVCLKCSWRTGLSLGYGSKRIDVCPECGVHKIREEKE